MPISKSHRASIISSALLKRVAESIVIFFPMFQVGCRSAISGVTFSNSAVGVCRNGPPEQVKIKRRTELVSRPSRHWKIALCSLSTGKTRTPRRLAASITTSPAMTRISLLATAMSLPASIAASAGRKPPVPTIAIKTKSASGIVANFTNCSTPSGPQESAVLASGNSRAASANSSAFECADIPTIRMRDGISFATLRALRPIEPVAPRITTFRILIRPPARSACRKTGSAR